MKKVFLDANTLYSGTTRSLFIWFHKNLVIEVFWSAEVWEEVFAAYARSHDAVEANKFRAAIVNNAITLYSECMVRLTEHTPIGLKDPDDEHVFAAAKECNADYLVTSDEQLLRENLSEHQIIQTRPDDLIADLLIKESPIVVAKSAHDHISSLVVTKPSIASYKQSLRRAGLEKFADWLEQRQKARKLFAEVWNP